MTVPGKGKQGAESKRPSLRLILVLYVVAPLALSMVLTGYVALEIWEEQVESRMEKDLEMVARSIQLPLSHSIERDRKGGIQQALESVLSIDSVYGAYAYDLKGEQIASAGIQDPEPEKRDKLVEMASKGEQKGEYGEVAKRDVYSFFVPLKDSGNQASGLLQLTRREEDFREYIGKVRRHALAWFGLGLSVMIGLVLVGQNQALNRHFKSIVSGMQRVAQGDTDHRLPISGPREISAISATFNKMLDSIQQAEREISRRRDEQRALESQLRQTEKLAAIGQLAAGVAHELGTPLSTVSGVAQRGLRREESGSKAAGSFRHVRREVERMEVIVRQLLDFSHKRKLQVRELRPDRVSRTALTSVEKEAASAGAEIELGGDVGAPIFSADPIRLEQALVNLLRNAIQAGTNAEIRIDWQAKDDWMVFSVDDNGPGVPKDIKPRLFEPFFTTKTVGEGTGLGLSVVHGIIKEHYGVVKVRRSEMGGARFELWLPLNNEKKGDLE